MQHKNQESAVHYISSNNLTGIKAGQERPSFLEIWMVVVDERIFARSWGFAAKSWYNTFLTEPHGKIKCGDQEFNIVAKIPDDLYEITSKINTAYLDKYNSGDNAKYATGITEPQHSDKTMEFVVLEE